MSTVPNGVVQVPPDGVGKKIDTSELTRPSDAVVVERQRTVIGDPTAFEQLASVDVDGSLLTKDSTERELLFGILEELKLLRQMLAPHLEGG